MKNPKPISLMLHVPDLEKASDWYIKVFPEITRVNLTDDDLVVLEIDGFYLEFVKSDKKVSSGACGTVLYWFVESFPTTIKRLKTLGANIYRGPIEIENRQSMCQFMDPFGNVIGIRGNSV